MEKHISGAVIRTLRTQQNLTQEQLAGRIGVSSKAVSKWETGKGLPDSALMEPLARALGVSIIELMSGEPVQNSNLSANFLRTKFYVCPICGNIIHAAGAAVISCCGSTLVPLEAGNTDPHHEIRIQPVEDEHFLTIDHPMTKRHFISFLAWVTSDRLQLVKLYPEGDAQTRLRLRGHGILYLYCNLHGLMKTRL